MANISPSMREPPIAQPVSTSLPYGHLCHLTAHADNSDASDCKKTACKVATVVGVAFGILALISLIPLTLFLFPIAIAVVIGVCLVVAAIAIITIPLLGRTSTVYTPHVYSGWSSSPHHVVRARPHSVWVHPFAAPMIRSHSFGGIGSGSATLVRDAGGGISARVGVGSGHVR